MFGWATHVEGFGFLSSANTCTNSNRHQDQRRHSCPRCTPRLTVLRIEVEVPQNLNPLCVLHDQQICSTWQGNSISSNNSNCGTRLLLSELWSKPDVSVICKLLCCSRALEQLVHSTCAGRLAVRLDGSAREHPAMYSSNSWPLNLGPCRWLAKHTRLCNNLEVWGLFLEVGVAGLLGPQRAEEIVVAGLSAARNQHSTSTGPVTRQRANSAAAAPQHSPAVAAAAAAAAFAAAREAAAAAGPISRGQHLQGLLLQHMHSYVPSDGSLLCSVAGSTQLTHLDLTIRKSATPAAGCRHELASLRGLQVLLISMDTTQDTRDSYTMSDLAVFDSIAPALRQLTSLTRLQVVGFNAKPRHLPKGLLQLRVSRLPGAARLDLHSLESVTRLELYNDSTHYDNLCEGDVLPPKLQQLRLHLDYERQGYASLQPLLQLPNLTQLTLLLSGAPFAEQVQELQSMPQLQQLDVECLHLTESDEDDMLALAGHLSARELPLTRFKASFGAFWPLALRPWQHLIMLQVSYIELRSPEEFTQFGDRLTGMPALRHLILSSIRPAGVLNDVIGAADESYDPLMKAVARLPTLRDLVLLDMPVGPAVCHLAAATHLKSLYLLRVGPDHAAQDAVCAALQKHVCKCIIWR